MPMIRAMRMLNAMEAGTLDGPGLDALVLADPSRIGELGVLLNMPGHVRRIMSSGTTLTGMGGAGAVWEEYATSHPDLMAALLANPQAVAAAAASVAASAVIAQNAGFVASVLGTAASRAAMLGGEAGRAALFASVPGMSALVASQPALDLVFADPVKLAGFRASTALASSEIPTMTSATLPSGQVTASSGTNPWQGMDKNTGTSWTTTSATNQWLRYSTTGVNRYIHRLRLWAASSGTTGIKNFRLEYSTDGTVWSTALTGTYPTEIGTNRAFDVNLAVAVPHWRLFVVDSQGGSVLQMPEIEMSGFVIP